MNFPDARRFSWGRHLVVFASAGILASGALGQVTVGTTVDLKVRTPTVSPGWEFKVHVGNNSDALIGLGGFYQFRSKNSAVPALNGGLNYLFCIEMAEEWPNSYLTYEIRPLWEASKNSQGPSSALIPSTGIGMDRALQLQLLFGYVFGGTEFNPGTIGNREKAALQLSIWELSHDTDFDIIPPPNAPPNFWVETPSSYQYRKATTLAQSWLDEVEFRFLNQDYSEQMPLWVLHHDNGQDQILAGYGGYFIPEPGTWAALCGSFALLSVFVARLKRRRG